MSKAKISPRGSSWDEFEKELFTPEEIAESDARVAIINEMIRAREEEGITQKQLEAMSGIKQPVISRMEKGTKDSLIKVHKIQDYIKVLRTNGTRAGLPYVKHIDGDIWELRPLRDRILFFAYNGDDIVLLSQFRKMTQKTPPREIKKANKLMKDYIERSKDYE